eukprot:gene12771-7045_t
MSLEVRNKPNENTNLAAKNWQNNDTLEEIVKYEYRKLNKTEFVEDDIEILRGQRLKFLGDWKDLTKEQKKIFPVGLSNLLDKVAGIEPENEEEEEEEPPTRCMKCCSWINWIIAIILIIYIIGFLVVLSLSIWRAVMEGISLYTAFKHMGHWSLTILMAIKTLITDLYEKGNKKK